MKYEGINGTPLHKDSLHHSDAVLLSMEFADDDSQEFRDLFRIDEMLRRFMYQGLLMTKQKTCQYLEQLQNLKTEPEKVRSTERKKDREV